jgi:uncharacterized protein YecT (DUF1311 family)
MRNALVLAGFLFCYFISSLLYGADMPIPSPTAPEENQNISHAKKAKRYSKDDANNSKIETNEDPCDGTSAMDQGECASNKYKVADGHLNDLYKQLMAALSSEGMSAAKLSLVTEQRSWIKFKENFCDSYGEANGGAQTWKSTYTVICLAHVTEIRANELGAYLNLIKHD